MFKNKNINSKAYEVLFVFRHFLLVLSLLFIFSSFVVVHTYVTSMIFPNEKMNSLLVQPSNSEFSTFFNIVAFSLFSGVLTIYVAATGFLTFASNGWSREKVRKHFFLVVLIGILLIAFWATFFSVSELRNSLDRKDKAILFLVLTLFSIVALMIFSKPFSELLARSGGFPESIIKPDITVEKMLEKGSITDRLHETNILVASRNVMAFETYRYYPEHDLLLFDHIKINDMALATKFVRDILNTLVSEVHSEETEIKFVGFCEKVEGIEEESTAAFFEMFEGGRVLKNNKFRKQLMTNSCDRPIWIFRTK